MSPLAICCHAGGVAWQPDEEDGGVVVHGHNVQLQHGRRKDTPPDVQQPHQDVPDDQVPSLVVVRRLTGIVDVVNGGESTSAFRVAIQDEEGGGCGCLLSGGREGPIVEEFVVVQHTVPCLQGDV